MNKEFDFAYVSTVTGDGDFALALAKSFAKIGKSFAIITPNKKEFLSYSENGVNSIYVGPHQEGCESFPDFDELSHFVECERSYFKLPLVLLRRFSRKINGAVSCELMQYKIKCVLQSQGGEVVRGAVFDYCKRHEIPCYIFGEYIKKCGGTVLYNDFKKGMLKPRIKQVLVGGDRSIDALITYDRKFEPPTEGMLIKIALYLKAGDFYSLFSALGYRAGKIVDRIFGAINSILYSRIDAELDVDKFIFVPLNVRAESELYIRNREFLTPINVFNKMRKIFPGNPLLFKGHPGVSLSIYPWELIYLRIKGVKVIDPQMPATNLLSKVRAVSFVSSTVGLEAISMGVPMYCFGHWPYNDLLPRGVNASDYVSAYEQGPFFEQLSEYLFKGHSFSTREELLDLCEAIAKDLQ